MKKQKYEPDDGPLSAEDLAAIRESAESMLPAGKVICQRSRIPDQVADKARHLDLATKLHP